MIIRVVLVAAILGGMAFAGAGGALATSGPRADIVAAPAAVDISGLTFSEAVNDRAEPINPLVEFRSGIDRVWVSFDYRNNDPGTRLTFVAQANGMDFRDGVLECCANRDGRFAFALQRRRGDLGGAAYEVIIYSGNSELTRGGFGVRGVERFDNDNRRDDDNDNGGDDNDNSVGSGLGVGTGASDDNVRDDDNDND